MKTRRFSDNEVVDVVVVGTGAGGAPLLADLARSGLKVVALEAGPFFDPRQHTPDEATASEIYWLEERLSGGANPMAFGGNNSGTGVGGSMLHFGAFMPRPDPRDMTLHSETGKGVDWPFGLDAVMPWIEQVEREIGVSGPEAYPWDPERRYAYPPPQRNGAAQAMARGCNVLGIRNADGPTALITRDLGDRKACVGCGACHQGCRNGAKSGTDVTYLPLAVSAGAEIRPNCFVHGIERDSAGRVTAVVYRENGQDRRQFCSRLVLAAGAVETARLLLHTGLANRSGQVGRNYMAHISTQVWGQFDEIIRPNKGYPSLTITEDMMRPEDADFAGGYLIQSLGMMPLTWATAVARGRGLWGEALTRYLRGYNYMAGIGAHGDCLPSDNNRVTLSDETGRAGVPKPKIDFSYGPNEQAMHEHMARTMTGIWKAAGAKDIWAMDRAAHMIGTCRMGTDPDQSVVDPFGRSHDIDNLWISDHSTFPSAMAANPALVIMALSLRTAEAIRTT